MPVRNPYALHPLMRKGGAHRTSASGARTSARLALETEADEVMAARSRGEDEPKAQGEGTKPRARKARGFAYVVFLTFGFAGNRAQAIGAQACVEVGL